MKQVAIHRFKEWILDIEALRFDLRYNVRTRADPREEERSLTANLSAGFWYRPVRPAIARLLLNDLPIQNFSDYTFVDFGSGKGRMLLIAADYPFHRIQGIEFRKDLHEAAVTNVRRYRNAKAKLACQAIECLHMDATGYDFPNGNMVLYFFNPFGEAILQKILDRLDASLEQNPRDVLMVMLYPQFASPADHMTHIKRLKETDRYRIYRSGDA